MPFNDLKSLANLNRRRHLVVIIIIIIIPEGVLIGKENLLYRTTPHPLV